MDASLPLERGFWFRDGADRPIVARSVREFATAIGAVPVATLARHLAAGDFSRWADDVLGDVRLASGLRKLEQVVRDGAPPSRSEILRLIAARYHLAELRGDAPVVASA